MFLMGRWFQRHHKPGKCGLTVQTAKKEKRFGQHLEISATIELIFCYIKPSIH